MDPYKIIQHPFVTEKTMNLLGENKLDFIVKRTADKPTIKKAVEILLEARVVQIRTYIDKEGEMILPPQFEEVAAGLGLVWPFENGLANVKLNGKWGYIDRNGEWVSGVQPRKWGN